MAIDRLSELKARAAKLQQTIVDKDVKDCFLRLPNNWLGDVERKEAPGTETVMLSLIDQLLARAEDAVSKYGPNLRLSSDVRRRR